MNSERSAGASYPAVARSVRATVLSLPYPRNARLSLLAVFPDNMVAHTTDKTCKTPIGIYAGRGFERFCRFRVVPPGPDVGSPVPGNVGTADDVPINVNVERRRRHAGLRTGTAGRVSAWR